MTPSSPERTPLTALSTQLRGAIDRFRRSPQIRAELAWVAGNKTVEFGILFLLLKLTTNLLGREGFGEYSLAETALILANAFLVTPVHEAYLRDYHGARQRGETRAATRFLLRWCALMTAVPTLLLILSSGHLARFFEVGRWTVVAAAMLFLCERWRIVGQDVLNIQRNRRTWAVQNLAFHLLKVAAITGVLLIGPRTPGAALLAHAAMAALFAVGVTVPLARALLASPGERSARLPRLAVTYGVPFAALLVFQWFQGFADRYLVKGLLDAVTVGLYIAAYQVCGIPYTLLLRVSHNLLTPIAYQRSRDPEDANGLWAADRVLLGGSLVQLAVGAAMLAVYALIGPQLVVLLTSDEFAVPATLVVLLAAGRFVQAMAQSLQPIFAVHHRLPNLIAFRCVGAVLTVGSCVWAIPRYGAIGAAGATFASLSVYLLVLLAAPGGCGHLAWGARRECRPAEGSGA